MNDEEFIAFLDGFGGELTLWPAHLQEDARLLAFRPCARGAKSNERH